MEVSISFPGECRARLYAPPGRYLVKLACDADALSEASRDAERRWRGSSAVRWDASVEVVGGSRVLAATNAVWLRFAGESRRSVYFTILGFRHLEYDFVEVRLVPREPCPLGPRAFLAIAPRPKQRNEDRWLLWNAVSAMSLGGWILYSACKLLAVARRSRRLKAAEGGLGG